MKVGLYFGSFNPVHYGHLLVAQEALCNEEFPLDQVWFVPSPQNPFKKVEELVDFESRFDMLSLVCRSIKNDKIKVTRIEAELPTPSYTYLTLAELRNKHPEIEFYVIIGSDNHKKLQSWKNYDEIIKNHNFIIIKRNGDQFQDTKHFIFLDSISNHSSTEIRKRIKKNKPINFFTPAVVVDYIKSNNLYI